MTVSSFYSSCWSKQTYNCNIQTFSVPVSQSVEEYIQLNKKRKLFKFKADFEESND